MTHRDPWSLAVLDYIAGLGRPLSMYDFHRNEDLVPFLQNYVRTYEGPNRFVRDLQRRVLFEQCNLTIHQLRGAGNFLQAQLQRQRGVAR